MVDTSGDEAVFVNHSVQDREDSAGEESERARPSTSSLKRKHSPALGSATPTRSPAPESTSVAPPPTFTPHTAHLPPSSYDFYSTSRTHPHNKGNYRYSPCGPSTSTSLPVGFQIHRHIESQPQEVRFSWEDRSPFVLITEDAKTITAEKGWRGARANVPIREGNWYWEITVNRAGGEGGREMDGVGEGSWCRVGVGRRESPLNAPVGFDGYSYSYRDRVGDAVTLSRPKPYGRPFTSGSTIGVYLSLPPRPTPSPLDRRDPARIVRKRVPIRYKGQLFFESLEYLASKEMDDLGIDPATKVKPVVEDKKAAPGTKAPPKVQDLGPPPRPLPKLEKSRIAFFLDGECQGVAYEDIYDFVPLRLHAGEMGTKGLTGDPRENWHDDGMMGYFPLVSVFGGAIATINPGPDFAYPPPKDIEGALNFSPHPPTSAPIVQPERKVDGEVLPPWRPLSDRYVEFLAEQTRLDDLDETASIKVFQAAREAEEALAAKNPTAHTGFGLPPPVPATKKGKLLVASMGAIKKEDVGVVGSPSASPRPASPALSGVGSGVAEETKPGVGLSALSREEVADSDGENVESGDVEMVG
ncbi:histone-lysine N-methyltransferase (Bre2) [Pseudohyphozyma bogoriensis]|nr:histone-lysine N-methyltransferase (Bre2) [Pseudohyphozyma bogoriensis]